MKLLAVIGNPIAHSLSPQIHQMFAEQSGLTVSYEKVESPLDGFGKTVTELLERGAIGFNITVPFKFKAHELANTLSRHAEQARAVNTIKRESSGLLSGHNTDGPGLVRDITVNLDWSIEDRRILILGAGGAVSGIVAPILEQDPECIHIVNRTHTKAEALADQYPARVLAIEPQQVAQNYDLVISGSSAGLPAVGDGEAEMLIPAGVIGHNTLCYDLIYSQKETPFLSRCRDLGARAGADGLGMLVEQAALAFEIWFGKRPDSAPVINKLRSGPVRDRAENQDEI